MGIRLTSQGNLTFSQKREAKLEKIDETKLLTDLKKLPMNQKIIEDYNKKITDRKTKQAENRKRGNL